MGRAHLFHPIRVDFVPGNRARFGVAPMILENPARAGVVGHGFHVMRIAFQDPYGSALDFKTGLVATLGIAAKSGQEMLQFELGAVVEIALVDQSSSKANWWPLASAVGIAAMRKIGADRVVHAVGQEDSRPAWSAHRRGRAWSLFGLAWSGPRRQPAAPPQPGYCPRQARGTAG